jgi:hypothetical protein
MFFNRRPLASNNNQAISSRIVESSVVTQNQVVSTEGTFEPITSIAAFSPVVVNPINDSGVVQIKVARGLVIEGRTAVFTVICNDSVQPGTVLSWQISGDVTAADIVGGQLSGTTVVDLDRKARISINIAVDALPEIRELLILTVRGVSASVIVLDRPPFPPGQQAFTSPGTFSWIAPANVDIVSVVAVGGGGGGQNNWSNPAGAGAGLGWRNNISVEPGTSYTVEVGAGGGNGSNGGNSFFQALSTVAGYGGGSASGQTGGPNGNGRGGGFFGDGGGAGGNATDWTGGGGAGGYTARGGNVNESGTSPNGGGGSGGNHHSSTHGTGAGGGVGLQGQGSSGQGHFTPWSSTGSPGGGGNGGSGGTRGLYGQNPWSGSGESSNNIQGGTHGGGGGGPGTSWPASSGDGGPGGVRIIWGTTVTRAFPSTNTGDL